MADDYEQFTERMTSFDMTLPSEGSEDEVEEES